jgi:hypothetical protein
MEKKSLGKPPFEGLRGLIEAAGYEVLSIGVEHTTATGGLGFSGVINLQITPKEWAEDRSFTAFTQIPQDLVSKCRECAVQPCQQSQ